MAESYTLKFSKILQADFKRLDPHTQRRVRDAIRNQLKAYPYWGRKLANKKIGQWRWRVGQYRIRYDIQGREILLHKVRHRREIYRKD